MKKLILILFLLGTVSRLSAQNHEIDSLLQLLKNEKNDTSYINILQKLATFYRWDSKLDSAILMAQKGMELSQSINYKKGQYNLMLEIGRISWVLGDFPDHN